MKMHRMDRELAKMLLKTAIGIIKQREKITLKRKNLIIELYQRMQIIKSKLNFQ
jgi:hypothetical protein